MGARAEGTSQQDEWEEKEQQLTTKLQAVQEELHRLQRVLTPLQHDHSAWVLPVLGMCCSRPACARTCMSSGAGQCLDALVLASCSSLTLGLSNDSRPYCCSAWDGIGCTLLLSAQPHSAF